MNGPNRSAAAEAPPEDRGRRAAGVIMVLAGGLCLSTAGILLRHIEAAGGWQILFYRGLFFALTLAIFLACRHRTRVLHVVRRIGRPGIFVGALLGVSSAFYVFGILSTTVANVVFIISAAPLITAVFARFILNERAGVATWIAILAALAGVGLMVGDGLMGGGLFGVLCALAVAVCFSAMLITLKTRTQVDMLPALCLGGIITALIALAMAPDLAVSRQDLAICFALGTVQFGGGFILITLGVRHIPAAEAALLSLTETVFAPVWVWIAIDEVPSLLTLTGGAVVIAAVAGRALYTARSRSDSGERAAAG